MEAERSSWAQAGINVTLSQSSFFTVIGNSTACTPGPTCTWELANWGANWVYTPDYYPTGEPNFLTNASSNSGSYSDPTNDQLITKTITTKTSVGTWASYLARQLPVVWQPSPVTELSEIQKTLRGVLPQDPTWNINPENWYYSK
jgi:peptide/nickel transport system substrate-binding protein